MTFFNPVQNNSKSQHSHDTSNSLISNDNECYYCFDSLSDNTWGSRVKRLISHPESTYYFRNCAHEIHLKCMRQVVSSKPNSHIECGMCRSNQVRNLKTYLEIYHSLVEIPLNCSEYLIKGLIELAQGISILSLLILGIAAIPCYINQKIPTLPHTIHYKTTLQAVAILSCCAMAYFLLCRVGQLSERVFIWVKEAADQSFHAYHKTKWGTTENQTGRVIRLKVE